MIPGREPPATGAGGFRRNDHARRERCEAEESVSRVLFPVTGRRSFIWDARYRAPRATNPRVKRSGAASSLLFGLSPGGVYRAAAVTGGTGELLPRLFTLAVRGCPRSWRCFFCGTFLGIASTGRYPAPCPAELGLSSGVPRDARDRLSSSTPCFPPKNTSKTAAAQLAPTRSRVLHPSPVQRRNNGPSTRAGPAPAPHQRVLRRSTTLCSDAGSETDAEPASKSRRPRGRRARRWRARRRSCSRRAGCASP